MNLNAYADDLARDAREASRTLRASSEKTRNAALTGLAKTLLKDAFAILSANAEDVEDAKNAGMASAMLDRLTLNPTRLKGIAKAVGEIAALPDPLNKVLSKSSRKDKLKIARVSVPIGTVLFIYESRPNVTIDGAALCLKSGNAVILRGGKESARTNAAFAACLRKALKAAKLPEASAQVVSTADRALLDLLLK